tara:strand:+ start:123 stop:911 length:789 start_codon:yes stop_codon:yes gene_type:complete
LDKELLKKPFVAVDTEFRRTTKDNMRLALLQINDGEEIYLIDTVLIDKARQDCNFLFSNSVVKIFHSCKEDLEAIFAWTDRQMINIFDTQLAHALLNNNFSISYQDLVEEKIGIVLEKKETRSNWLRRPLSDDQLKYAALDVEYLIYLYELQVNELNKNKKIDWHRQDIDRLIKNTFNPNLMSTDIPRTLPLSQEKLLLFDFNEIVQTIAKRENISPTLFFSKKAQKDFLRTVLLRGLNPACEEITIWRKDLIYKDLLMLLK